MSARLPASLWVAALVRRVQAAGGFAAVLARGDADRGAILLVCRGSDGLESIYGRVVAKSGASIWERLAQDETSPGDRTADYLARQRNYDPDLWIVELDIASPERFIVESAALD